MGRFFNETLKDLHKLPDSKTLEKMRKEYNDGRTLHSESTEESGITSGDGRNAPESQPAVLSAQDGPEPARPVRQKRTRKARSDKGKGHQQHH